MNQKEISPLEKRIQAAKAYKQNALRYNIISAVVISAVVAVTAVLLAVLPRPETSELEKRELVSMPKFSVEALFSGEFFSGIADHFSDTVPYREQLVVLNSRIKKAMGISAPTFYGAVDIVADDEGNSLEETLEPNVTQQTDNVPQQTEIPEQTAADTNAAETAVDRKSTRLNSSHRL